MLLQAWLNRHGPFDAIVDGANVGLFNQNFVDGGFNFHQVPVFLLILFLCLSIFFNHILS